MSTVLILDWDGTLCPTPHLRSVLRTVKSPETKKRLYAFMDGAAELLASLMKFIEQSNVNAYIVTDSPEGWVLELAKAFFPQIVPFFSDNRIQVRHTSVIKTVQREQTQHLSVMEKMLNSKLPTFREILIAHHQQYGIKPKLISIGDSVIEHLAASECLKQSLVDQIQIIKFQTGLSLDLWQKQIVTLKSLLKKMINRTECDSGSHRFDLDETKWICETELPKTMTCFYSPRSSFLLDNNQNMYRPVQCS